MILVVLYHEFHKSDEQAVRHLQTLAITVHHELNSALVHPCFLETVPEVFVPKTHFLHHFQLLQRHAEWHLRQDVAILIHDVRYRIDVGIIACSHSLM